MFAQPALGDLLITLFGLQPELIRSVCFKLSYKVDENSDALLTVSSKMLVLFAAVA